MASAGKELTFAEIAGHNTKKDLYMVVHDQVYNVSGFVDEHPGGEEVLLDVGGQDASEAFEDVGHSDEAREILKGMLVGKLKRVAGDAAPAAATSHSTTSKTSTESGGLGVAAYVLIIAGGALAYLAYQYTQNQNKKI